MHRRIRLLSLLAAMAWLALLPALAWSGDAPQEIAVTLEKNRFQPDEIKVKAGAPFAIVLTNKDKGPEEFDMQQPRIEKVVPPGKTVKIRIPALKPGAYPFVGEYHNETAKGKIVAQ